MFSSNVPFKNRMLSSLVKSYNQAWFVPFRLSVLVEPLLKEAGFYLALPNTQTKYLLCGEGLSVVSLYQLDGGVSDVSSSESTRHVAVLGRPP